MKDGFKTVKKAVIPAGGFGTRMLPATKALAKEMLPLLDKPVLQYIVEEAMESGVEEILIITNREKGTIIDHFDKSPILEKCLENKEEANLLAEIKKFSGMDIHYIRQKEPIGLGDAILHAKSFAGKEPVGVLLGDAVVKSFGAPCLLQLINEYRELEASIVGVREVSEEEVTKYGLVKSSELDKIKKKKYKETRQDMDTDLAGNSVKLESIIEKPAVGKAPSTLGTMGRYILSPGIFESLERVGPGVGGELQLTDAIDDLAKREYVYAYHIKGKRYDTGNLKGYLKALLEFSLDRKDVGKELREYLKRF